MALSVEKPSSQKHFLIKLKEEEEEYPDWYYEKVMSMDGIENAEFYSSDGDDIKEISVKDIIGTTHDSYNNRMWLEMLNNLKRKDENTDEEAIKTAILDGVNGKSVSEYNGKYYILDGNHRLCYAKFLKIEKVYCNVSKHKFNYEDFDLYTRLKESGFSCTYGLGEFKDIKLGETNIYIDPKEGFEKLLEKYKSIKFSTLQMIFFCPRTPIDRIVFTKNENFERNLKYAKMSYCMEKKEVKDALQKHKLMSLILKLMGKSPKQEKKTHIASSLLVLKP